MKSSAKKVELASVDDLFSTEESRADDQREKVIELPLTELHPPKNHPFKVKDDEAMIETADSIRQYGVLVPGIARPDPEGGYELVAGNRRHRGSELAGLETMPVIVRDLDDDEATIIMVDSNLQRESLLPSERAFAYKLKLEAIKHQGQRSDLTSVQVEQKPLYDRYRKSNDKEKFLRGHESEIILFEAAARELKRLGAVPLPTTESMKKDLANLNAEKERLLAEYKAARTEAQEYDTVKQNVDALLTVPKRPAVNLNYDLE